jgi:HK97 family phage prohead protease
MLAAAQARLDAVLSAAPKASAPTEHHLLLKARTLVDADKGDFEAIISSESTDREKDVVLAPAMVTALKAWTKVNKLIPLLWSHSAAPEDVVGHIEPQSARAVNGQVLVSRWINQDTERGKEAWRLVKSGTLGFSFGYLILDAVKRDDGVREIRALDVFEVSATATPMNGTTRVLSWKSRNPARARREDPDRVPTLTELHAREVALGVDGALDRLEDERRMLVPTMDELAQREAALGNLPFIGRLTSLRAPSVDAAVERLRVQMRDEMTRVLSRGSDTGKAYASRRPRRPRDEQRARANQVAAEFELERALTFDPRTWSAPWNVVGSWRTRDELRRPTPLPKPLAVWNVPARDTVSGARPRTVRLPVHEVADRPVSG